MPRRPVVNEKHLYDYKNRCLYWLPQEEKTIGKYACDFEHTDTPFDLLTFSNEIKGMISYQAGFVLEVIAKLEEVPIFEWIKKKGLFIVTNLLDKTNHFSQINSTSVSNIIFLPK